ncbi:hypothetical protein [Testudinibacter sp. TR-2022]|uniref:hypothetical protein n=1 Tax=Testudinibacter sp. TR-2022 TaxID=2585029 RepID=UPI00111A2733|nr:hypothetical protein [Testudinibacter sp. TR-2022]TNH06510.1 hypothetical protein FHQ30_07720 [Pasteurellaceae bacterium Phil11]TNH25503.1 hypothetical protein FHQ29_01140 [Testudinibacter sp. TR-2022]TNH28079.1 hypothetical protein FHQ27_03745 [Testudinibacter sp. TR-2022]
MLQIQSKFSLERWYNVMMLLSVALFTVAGLKLFPDLPSIPFMFLAGGVFFISLGEMTNHPYSVKIHPELNIKIYGYSRIDSVIGWCFNLIGAGLFITGLVKLF